MGKLAVSILNHEYDVHIGPDTYQLFATDYAELARQCGPDSDYSGRTCCGYPFTYPATDGFNAKGGKLL